MRMMTSKHLPVTSPPGAQRQYPAAAAAAATLPAPYLDDMQITEKLITCLDYGRCVELTNFDPSSRRRFVTHTEASQRRAHRLNSSLETTWLSTAKTVNRYDSVGKVHFRKTLSVFERMNLLPYTGEYHQSHVYMVLNNDTFH